MSSGCFYAEYLAQDVLWESGKGKCLPLLKACISVQSVCNLCVCEGIGPLNLAWRVNDYYRLEPSESWNLFLHDCLLRTWANVVSSTCPHASVIWYKLVQLCYLLSYLVLSKIQGSITCSIAFFMEKTIPESIKKKMTDGKWLVKYR